MRPSRHRVIEWSLRLLLAVGTVAVARAQQGSGRELLFGPTVGMSVSRVVSSIPIKWNDPECGVITDGSGRMIPLGGSVAIPSFFSRGVGLTIDATVTMMTTDLHGAWSEPRTITDAEAEHLYYLDHEARLHSSFLRGCLGMLLRWEVDSRLVLSAGPIFGVQSLGEAIQSDKILGPDDFAFLGGQTEQTTEGGERMKTHLLQLGGAIRLGYSLPVGRSTWLLPEIELSGDITPHYAGFNARSVSLGGHLSLLFDATPAREPLAGQGGELSAPPRGVVPEPEVAPPTALIPLPKAPRLSASVELYGVDEAHHRLPAVMVRAHEILYRQHAPLLPVVYFDRDSAVIAPRYPALARSAADTFLMEDLVGLDLLGIQHHLLNVVGERMRRNRSARLTLLASTSSDEAPDLAGARAEAVRSYLTGVWGIDRSRVVIRDGEGAMQRSNEATEDGRQDNRRVELIGTPPALLEQVVTDEVVRDFNPPMISMSPMFEAEAGVREWTLAVTQGGSEVARYSSRDTGDLTRRELVWNIVKDRIDSGLSPLLATLTVVDSTGAVAVAHAEVPLVLDRKTRVIDKRIEVHGDRERISFGLVNFDYNVANLKRPHELEVREIARVLRDGAEVTITGFTDRIGDERYNVGLSHQRAEKVASLLKTMIDALGLEDVRVRWSGAGIERERFDNSLPEGRGLSRGVSVTVEQSIPGPDGED